MNKTFEIIDFHTHPFLTPATNICGHKGFCDMNMENTKRDLQGLGISKICGSVISLPPAKDWQNVKKCNDEALQLWELYGDFYIPGFHVHPDFVKQSCEEIERMHKLGVHLVGELVPYLQGWEDYSCKAFSEILDLCAQYNMVVSFHSQNEDAMDKMVKEHKNITFVAAHPGEYREFMRHLERAKYSENYYLDLSGTGMFRHGMLRRAIDQMGAEHILFGSDYPTCNPAMYIGGVLLDYLITDAEKELIFSKNAKRLLKINE